MNLDVALHQMAQPGGFDGEYALGLVGANEAEQYYSMYSVADADQWSPALPESVSGQV